MALLLFWTKIAIRRIIQLIKSSPLPVIILILFIGAVIYTASIRYIEITLDIQKILAIISFLIFSSFISSLKYNNLTALLLRYSKSKYNNKIVFIRYFIKQAILKNILFLIFCVISYNYLINKLHIFVILGFCLFSIALSFLIIYKKNDINIQTAGINVKKLKINPSLKSAVQDYFTAGMLVSVILSIILLIFIFLEYLKNINNYIIAEKQSVLLILMSLCVSLGFPGIFESIPKINWKYQALISPNDFNYHFKRTIFFLGGICAPVFVVFIIFGSIINYLLLLKYLYCIFTLFFIAVNISLTITHMLIKVFLYFIIIILTMWITTLPPVFLPVMLFPVVIIYFKAKSEYKEWFLK